MPRGRGTAPAPRGLASASLFLTVRPWTTSRTASSVILPDLVRGMSATATILAGTWRGLAPERILSLIFPSSVGVERYARRQAHEQHDAHIIVPVLADADRLDDLRQLLDLVVDLGGADPYAARIERRIGAAVDDHAAMPGPFGEIAMAPDIVEALEIGGVVLLAVRIVPEADRHRGEGAGADELALLAARRGRPSSSQTSIAMPRPGPWISPT